MTEAEEVWTKALQVPSQEPWIPAATSRRMRVPSMFTFFRSALGEKTCGETVFIIHVGLTARKMSRRAEGEVMSASW